MHSIPFNTNTSRSKALIRQGVLSLLFVAALGSFACSSTQPASEQISDAEITTKIKAKLTADPEINPFNIDVDTLQGVVHLTGQVEKPIARSEAAKLARDTKGVKSVDNDITIGDKTMGESVTDTEIATKVKAKLTADPDINPFNIDVDVEYQVVTLSGIVATSGAKAEAERLAKTVKEVKSVKNMLKVKI